LAFEKLETVSIFSIGYFEILNYYISFETKRTEKKKIKLF